MSEPQKSFLLDSITWEEARDRILHVTVVSGTELPTFEVETKPCSNGCCTHALLVDRANGDETYWIGGVNEPNAEPPEPLYTAMSLSRLMASLN